MPDCSSATVRAPSLPATAETADESLNLSQLRVTYEQLERECNAWGWQANQKEEELRGFGREFAAGLSCADSGFKSPIEHEMRLINRSERHPPIYDRATQDLQKELEDLRQKNTELRGSNARYEEECMRLQEDLAEAEAEKHVVEARADEPQEHVEQQEQESFNARERDEAEMEDLGMKHSEEVQRLKRQLRGAYDQSGRRDPRKRPRTDDDT